VNEAKLGPGVGLLRSATLNHMSKVTRLGAAVPAPDSRAARPAGSVRDSGPGVRRMMQALHPAMKS
jgi:hypothetical protein